MKAGHLTLLAAMLAGSLLPLASAHATETLETVQVTATRRAESTFDVPVATDVIDRDEIRAAAPQTVMEALRGKTGAHVQQTTPGQGIVILRGLKGSEILHVGAEFAVQQRISDSVEWRAQLTWTHGEESFAGDDYPADRIPPLNGSAGITWRPATRWTLDGWLNFADQQDRYSRATTATRGFGRAARRAGRPGASARRGQRVSTPSLHCSTATSAIDAIGNTGRASTRRDAASS